MLRRRAAAHYWTLAVLLAASVSMILLIALALWQLAT
jgi:hypothetical protein